MTDIVERLRATDVGYPTDRNCRDAADEIERLQEAKRRALAIADERSKENVGLRQEIERLQATIAKAKKRYEEGDADYMMDALRGESVDSKVLGEKDE
jgi:hypothetical protein